MTFKRQTAHFLLFLAGLALFVFSIYRVGMGHLAEVLRSTGGWGIAFLAIYSVMNAWETFAWRSVFPGGVRRQIGFLKLYSIRLAGEAVNSITPFIDIGGEFLKYDLLTRHFRIKGADALSGVVLSRMMLLFSEFLFWILGITLAVMFLPVSEDWKRGVMIGALIFGAICLGLFALQKNGFFLTVLRGLERVGIRTRWLGEAKTGFGEADQAIASFYSRANGRFIYVFLLNFLGWILGGVEMWVLFQILGHPVSFPQAVMVESFLHLIRTLSFFIPANMGAQEAGLAVLAQGMGFHPSVGVAISLLKRLRQLVWIGAGFLGWGYFQQKERRGGKTSLICDTPLDSLIHRPPARVLVRFFSALRVTPNQVSFLALFCSFLSAVFFAKGSLAWGLVALFFGYAWAVLDHADGELARATGKTSDFGKQLDDISDTIASIAILCGVFYGALKAVPEDGWPLFNMFFFPALCVSSYFGFMISVKKQNVRQKYLRAGAGDRRFIRRQRLLNLFTGREPLYLLLFLALFAFYMKTPWVYVLLNILIFGCYAFGLGYFIVHRRLQMSRVFASLPAARSERILAEEL